MFGGYIVCNGPTFSPDGCKLYFSKSSEREREIIAFAYDAVIRDVGKLRLLNKITGANGYPDGLTVDLDGHVCCARWGGGVSWFSP